MNVGSFTDRGSVGVTSSTGKSYNAIDPALIQIGSDYYLNFGSFWGDLYQVKMKSTPTAASGSSVQIAYQPSGSHAIEGAYQIYYSGYYYLFWSEGQCCGLDASRPASGGEYKIRVCRSKTGTGSFVRSIYIIRDPAFTDKSNRSTAAASLAPTAEATLSSHPMALCMLQEASPCTTIPPTVRSHKQMFLMKNIELTVAPINRLDHCLPLRRHHCWLRRRPEEIRLEQAQVEQRMAHRLNKHHRHLTQTQTPG